MQLSTSTDLKNFAFLYNGIKKINPIPCLDIERRCSMLFLILQALWQQIGPQATQFVNSPAFFELLKNLGRVPPHIYVQGGRFVSKNVSDWYQSLSPEEKQRLQDAMIWVAKDLTGDVAAAATGLPIGSFELVKT